MTSHAQHSGPVPAGGPPRARHGRTAIVVAAVVAVAVVIVVVAVTAGGAARAAAKPSRAVSETAGPVSTVDFRGVPGQLTITATSAGQVRLTGDLNWKNHAPAARYLVSTQVTWGYVKVGVPQSGTSSRHVTARLTSSELELLP